MYTQRKVITVCINVRVLLFLDTNELLDEVGQQGDGVEGVVRHQLVGSHVKQAHR